MKTACDPNIIVRPEQPGDEDAIDQLLDAAFSPSKIESRLVRLLRQRGQLIGSLVATSQGRIVGHAAFSPVMLGGDAVDGGAGLAPVAVLPEFQNRSIGSALCREGLQRMMDLGWRWIVVVGHPTYYPRFGFTKGSAFGLSNEYGVDDPFMAIELVPGALKHRGGMVRYSETFAEVLKS